MCSFICTLAITIGHATISALNINILSNAISRSDQANFRVKFVEEANDRTFRKITGGAIVNLYASSSYYTGYVPAFRIA